MQQVEALRPGLEAKTAKGRASLQVLTNFVLCSGYFGPHGAAAKGIDDEETERLERLCT